MSETTAPASTNTSTTRGDKGPQVHTPPQGVQTREAGQQVTVQLPVCQPEGNEYIPLKIEARLTDRQARALFALRNALDRQTATTDNGQRVVQNPDALRWLLEQIADQLDEPEA